MMELRRIDELVISDHYNLDLDDECYYYMEYTAHAGFAHSQANSLISNLKKLPSRRALPGWRFKAIAIGQVASMFRETLNIHNPGWTIVPVPSSKTPDHVDYDDRMLQVVRQYCGDEGDIRELIRTVHSRDGLHTTDNRRDVAQLQASMELNPALINNLNQNIVIVDDVLTTGATFKACKNLILNRFPEKNVIGIFVARRSLPPPIFDFSQIFESE